MQRLKNIINSVFNTLINLIVKEDRKIENLLKLEPGELYRLLPKSTRKIDKNCLAIFDYRNKVVKTIIKSIKFKNNLFIKKRLAIYVYDELTAIATNIETFSGSTPIIMPMPMSKKEILERGFNQCEEILKEVKKLDNNSLQINFGILKKIRDTQRQVKLDRNARIKNLNMSMCVFLKSEATIKTQHPEQSEGKYFLKNRVVIVFDDVYTTGASFREARRALLSSGVKEVLGLFLAH